MPILLIDNTDSFTYNLYQMLQSQTEERVEVVRNNAITFSEVLALAPSRIVLSPGPGQADCDADIGVCKVIIAEALFGERLQMPLLGVCLGHQAIAHALGGRLQQLETVVHGKTSPIIQCAPSPLWTNIDTPFEAMRYHSWSISPAGFPEDLQLTATTEDGQVMAFQHQNKPIYGVQFHPESIGTPLGEKLLANFLQTHFAMKMLNSMAMLYRNV